MTRRGTAAGEATERDGATWWLRIVYEVAANAPIDRLERELAEACRRHRAHPRDIAVAAVRGDGPGSSIRLTVTTVVPASADGRPRDALLRDIETLLGEGRAGAWRRLSCQSGAAERA
jgi:hypothetical protein